LGRLFRACDLFERRTGPADRGDVERLAAAHADFVGAAAKVRAAANVTRDEARAVRAPCRFLFAGRAFGSARAAVHGVCARALRACAPVGPEGAPLTPDCWADFPFAKYEPPEPSYMSLKRCICSWWDELLWEVAVHLPCCQCRGSLALLGRELLAETLLIARLREGSSRASGDSLGAPFLPLPQGDRTEGAPQSRVCGGQDGRRLCPADRAIVQTLQERGPLRSPGIAERAGYQPNYVRARLAVLMAGGRVIKVSGGYALPPSSGHKSDGASVL
jgi:hypothetical protein